MGRENGEKKGNLIASHELMTLVFGNRNPLPAIANYSFLKDSGNYTNQTRKILELVVYVNPYPTAFPYGNGMVLHFYQQQESSTTKTVHRVINKGLKAYV